MKIVITDGIAVNPGDLSWDIIAAFGQLSIYDRSHPSELPDRCRDADIILCNKTPLGKELLDQLTHLRLISVMATGYNTVDVKAAAERNILVCNVPAYGTASVAQHTIALLLEICNRVGLHADSVRSGEWSRSSDWSYAKTPLIELDGKKMGIVGLGHIGEQTARIARALGMEVYYYNRHKKQSSLAEYMNLEELFSNADVICLHCPLTSENAGFVNKSLLRQMKPSAILINTARGQLITESDLALALQEGWIAGAALDVLSTEPPDAGNPLLSAKNCIITPHNAWMSREARERILRLTAENISAFLRNAPIHVVKVS